jgi:muramoyltetrapeptide carboxypeptidase
MLIRPQKLSPGDTLGIIAPASAPPDPKAVDRAVDVLKQLGYRIKLAPNVHKRLGFLAGTDRERASDVIRMFAEKKVDAVLCVRGGYGTARLLPLLDYKVIAANPKIFVGFSDITSLHCAFLTKAKLVSFHGPMLVSDFSRDELSQFAVKSFLETLSGQGTGLGKGYSGKTVKVLRRGVARGRLVGGNLTVLCTLLGTPWMPTLKGRILFIEDIGELPYRFDRMLTQLLNCGLLQQVAGVAVGLNADCEDPKAKVTTEYRQSLEDVLKERLLPLKIPVVTGLPFGHVPDNGTLPVGIMVELDAERGELNFLGPCVR